MRKIGLIVNPVAGMGGSVGLKGTDGEMYQEALKMGAEPVSPARTAVFLTHISCRDSIRLLTAPGPMGAQYAEANGFEYEAIGSVSGQPAANDTRAIAREMIDAGIELIVFAGGDGTARDVADAIDTKVPVIGIPAGVKVYSGVFAYSARTAAELLDAFVEGAGVSEQEVLDIDEDAFRAGRVDSRHYGFLLVPEARQLVQAGKDASAGGASPEVMQALAGAVIDEIKPDVLYLLGSGTTIRFIADNLGIEKTLLGVDAVIDGKLVGSDLNEQGLLALLDRYPSAVIVVTVLGGNGFIFGRGNKQFTPEVLKRVGLQNIVVVANREKLLQLSSLHVDTGDPDLDAALRGYIDVVVGQGHKKLMPVR